MVKIEEGLTFGFCPESDHFGRPAVSVVVLGRDVQLVVGPRHQPPHLVLHLVGGGEGDLQPMTDALADVQRVL